MNAVHMLMPETTGSTARIAPKMLITSDPDLVRRMSAARSTFTRGSWYTCLKLHPDSENVVCYTDEDKHNDMRSRLSHGYSGKENMHLEQDVDDLLIKLLGLIQNEYVTKPESGVFRTMELSDITSFFTLDIISKIAFGEPFGFIDSNQDSFGYMENLYSFVGALALFGTFHEFAKILKIPLVKAMLPSSVDQRGLGRVMGFAKARVEERFGKDRLVRRDMLNSFIKNGLNQSELEGETILQITAGSDSSATALRTTLYFVSTSPPVLERLLAEVREAIADNRVSRPIIKDTEARELPYLQACIKEG